MRASKYYIIGFAVIICCALAVGYNYERQVDREIVNNARKNAEGAVELVSSLVYEKLAERTNIISATSKFLEYHGAPVTKDRIEDLHPVARQAGFTRFIYYDLTGKGYSTDRQISRCPQEVLKQALSGMEIFPETLLDENGQETILFSKLIYDQENKPLGILAGVSPLEPMQRLVQVDVFGRTDLIHIVGSDGRRIFKGRLETIERWQERFDSLKGQIAAKHGNGALFGEPHTDVFHLEGEEYLVVHTPIGVEDLHAVGIVPYSLVTGTLTNILEILMKVLLIFMGLIAIIMAVVYAEKKENDAYVHRLAYLDELTGVGNKNYFMERLAELRKEAQGRWILFLVDISQMKSINKRVGTAGGNRVLCRLAEYIQRDLEQDEFVARLHSDQFVLVKRYTELEELWAYGTDLRDFLNTLEINHKRLFISCRIGTVIFAADSEEESQYLLDKAITAKQIVKENPESFLKVYDEELRRHSEEDLALRDEVLSGLSANEFSIYYQPKYACFDGRLVGAEALIRWFNRKKGFIAPDKFIPVCEHNGFVWLITKYVFEQVCKRVAGWKAQGLHLVPISINISGADLYQQELLSYFDGRLSYYGLSADMFELEITETAFIDDLEAALRVLKQLKEKGFKIDIDDFGTGYSALVYLQSGVFDVVKIDKSFLDNRARNRLKGEKLLRSIIYMIKGLGLECLCEGAETKEQVEFLRSIGCDSIQGYYFDRPMTAASFAQVLQKGRSQQV